MEGQRRETIYSLSQAEVVTTVLQSLLLYASAAASVLDREAPLGFASAAMAPACSASQSRSALGFRARKGGAANTAGVFDCKLCSTRYLMFFSGQLDMLVNV